MQFFWKIMLCDQKLLHYWRYCFSLSCYIVILERKKNILSKVSFVISSGTDEVRAKRDPSLCNESVNGHFWSNLCLNCIFKWTWFVKTDIWSVIRSRVRFPVEAALIIFLFSPIFLSFLTRFLFCSTRISKVDKCAAFQLWTPTYFL